MNALDAKDPPSGPQEAPAVSPASSKRVLPAASTINHAAAHHGVSITLAGESCWALPGGVLWWPGEDTAFIADLHLGRATARRVSGLPCPDGTDADDLLRLSACLLKLSPRRLIVLGDLLHAPTGWTPDLQADLRLFQESFPTTQFSLVLGNHDRPSRQHLGNHPGLEMLPSGSRLGPFSLFHEPPSAAHAQPADRPLSAPPTARPYALAGHLHPGFTLQDATGCRIRQKCFHFGPHLGVLPAYGTTTAAGRISPEPGDTILAVDAHRVIPIPPELLEGFSARPLRGHRPRRR